jgi:hypothetical protein
MPDIAYTWKIERMDCYPKQQTFENVVSTVHWRLFATGGGCEATSYGTAALDTSSLGPFTPYDKLTEAQVVGWVRTAIDGAAQEAALAQNIASQLAPPIVSPPLPWAASAVGTPK